jgi:hypothetical protein
MTKQSAYNNTDDTGETERSRRNGSTYEKQSALMR